MLVLTQLDPCALEQELLARVDAAHPREAGARTLVVVPTTRLGAWLQRRLADVRPAWLGLDVLHFHALAFRILDDSGKAPPRLLSARLSEAMLRGALQSCSDNSWAEYTRRRPGTLRRLAAAIGDLREAGVTPDELETVAATGPDGDLAALYRAYVEALGRAARLGWADEATLIRAAVPHAAEWAGRFGAIFLHGAYELIGTHTELLRALDSGCTVTALLPAAPGRRVSEYADAFIDRALGGTAAAERLPDPLPIEQRPELAALFDEESRPRPGGNFRFRHTQGVSAEVAVAVREALAAVHAGCPPTAIAITARTIEPYAAALEGAFDEHGFPWAGSLRAPLLRQPLARDFLSALRVVGDDFPRGPTAELLRSPRLEWTRLTGGARPPAGSRADAWSRSARILGGLDEWRDDLPAWVHDTWGRPRRDEDSQTAAERSERYEREARRIGAALVALHDRIRPAARRWGEHAERLTELFEELFVPPDDATTRAASNALHDLLAEMGRLDSILADERPVPFAEAVAWLDDAVAGTALPLRSGDDGGIRVLDAMQLRGLTFRHVHVLGLNSGIMPRPPRRDPVLDDGLRAALAERYGRPLLAKAAGIAEERLLLSQLLGAASERVDVSWQRADESGRARTPSLVLREIVRIAFGVPDVARIDARHAHLPSHPEHWLDALVERTGLLTGDEQALLLALKSDSVRTARAALEDHPELHPGLQMLRATQSFHPPETGAPGAEYDAVVGPPGDRALSVSALEDLGRCPLQFFFRHVLRVRELEQEADPFAIMPKEQGTQVHGILEKVYSQLAADGRLARDDPDEAARRAQILLETERSAILGVLDAKLARRLPLLHERLVNQWFDTLRRFIAADLKAWDDGGWSARDFERFVEGPIPAGEITQELRGRFDRTLEECRDDGKGKTETTGKVLIGDYKASTSLKRRVNPLEMLRGAALQVPLYAMLEGGDAEVELLGVHPDLDYDDPSVWRHSFQGLKGEMETGFRETLAELLGLFRRGEFPFHEGKPCEWCAFHEACRRNHPPSVERQKESAPGRLLDRLHAKTQKAPLLKGKNT